MHSSKSDKSVGSKRCCNRNTCPFYMCTNEQHCTSYENAQGSTSTRFLYFGPNFQNHPSGDIQEFKDCGSDTEIRANATNKPHCSSAMNTMPSNDPRNYGNTLKQIIAMSQNLLNQIEQQNQGTTQFTGHAINPNSNCRMAQSPAKYGVTSMPTQTCGRNIPQNIRVLQIEPVQITVPFIVDFHNTCQAAGSPSGTSCIMGQAPSVTFRPVVEIPHMSCQSAVDRFPYTPGTQAGIYVSEGKFPPLKIEKMDESDRCNDQETRVNFSNIQGNDCQILTDVCVFDMNKMPEADEVQPRTADKEVQTGKKHRNKRLSQDAENQRESTDTDAEANSNGNNTHINPDTEATIKVFSAEEQLPNEILDDKTLPVANSQRVSFSSPNEIQIKNEGDSSQRLPEEEQIKLYEELEQRRQSQLQEKQLQELLEEQQLYEKPPPPPLDYSENKTISLKLPQNMNYPSQFARCDPKSTSTQPPCSSNSLNMNLPQIGIPMYYECICTQKMPCAEPGSSQTSLIQEPINISCHSLPKKMPCAEPSSSQTSLIQEPINISCHSIPKKMPCAEPSSSQTSLIQEPINISCRSLPKQSCSATCTGDDDFHSAQSGSETDISQKSKTSRKKKICQKKKTSSPVDSAMLQVLEGMMKVLISMNCANQRGRDNSQQNSAQTGGTQSSIICEMEDENTICISEITSLHNLNEMPTDMARRFFTCLKDPCYEEEQNDSIINENENEVEVEEVDSKPCEEKPNNNECCCEPYLMITFNPETGIPCCCLHSGKFSSHCREIPVCDVTPQALDGPCTSHRSIKNEAEEHVFTTEEYEDEEICGNVFMPDDEIIDESQIRVVTTEECFDEGDEDRFVTEDAKLNEPLSCHAVMIAPCAETQTDECFGLNLVSTGVPSTELLDELRAFRDELYESETSNHLTVKSISIKSRSGGDIHTECDCCHCRAERRGFQTVSSVDQSRTEFKALVDAVISDLETMEMVRRQNINSLDCLDQPIGAPRHAQKSFPVTITEVSELGKCSLYVKWVIHDCFGIAGYELYVDGYLTNRYFNSRHEAAVVCQIDVKQPHKIALVAKPKDMTGKAIVGPGDIYGDDISVPIPKNWSPSIYLYEPSDAMDYIKMF